MEKIKELFIPKKLAILAKEFGFDEPVIGFFDIETDELYPSIQEVNTLIEGFGDSKEIYKNYCLDDSIFINYNGYISFAHEYPAITWCQIIDWFRKQFQLTIMISEGFEDDKGLFWVDYNYNNKYIEYIKWFETYNEARENGIKRAFEIIINKQYETNGNTF